MSQSFLNSGTLVILCNRVLLCTVARVQSHGISFYSNLGSFHHKIKMRAVYLLLLLKTMLSTAKPGQSSRYRIWYRLPQTGLICMLKQHRWFSGKMLACHVGGPGSIPGRCSSIFGTGYWDVYITSQYFFPAIIYRDIISHITIT
jgi:hypothetical protein